MWVQETYRLLHSQQVWMSVIYMYYLNTKCAPDHHHNGSMAISALGHALVRFEITL